MLVDLHVQSGSCITDWTERENRQSLWCSVQQFEMRVNFMNLVIEQLHAVEDGEVGVSLLIQTSICHINTLHNCFGSLHSPNTEILSYACVAHNCPVRGAQKKCVWYVSVLMIMTSSYTHKPSFCLLEKMLRGLLATSDKTYALHFIALKIFL